MHVLVTGGAGFIGSHLATRLRDRGDVVTVIDNFSTGPSANVPDGVEWFDRDLTTPTALDVLGARTFDAVCHLAGQSSGEKSFENPLYDFDANARSTLILASWAMQHMVETFVHASSMAVYGQIATLPVPETAIPHPVSFYGASKRTAEEILSLVGDRFRTVSLRMFSVYGPGQDLAELKQGMASIYLSYVLKGDPVEVKGSLERVRDLIYIDDVVSAWEAALDRPVQGAFNVGTGIGTSVGSLLDLLFQACGKDHDYPIVESPGTPGDQQAAYADTIESWRAMGWRARVPLSEGLEQLVTWAAEQRARRV